MRALGRIAILLFPILFAGRGSAQDEVVLSDHHLIHGKVTASTADSVTFVHDVNGTETTSVFKASDLDPHSFYIIRSQALSNTDAAGHAALGDYCQANGLFTRARDQYYTAAKIDPSMKDNLEKQHNECLEGSGEQLLAQAKAQDAKGDFEGAYRTSLAVMRYYPDTASAAEARQLNSSVHEQSQAKAQAASATKSAKESSAEVQQAQERIQKAVAANRKGLNDQQFSSALRLFEQSVDEYKMALKDLAKGDSSDQTVSALIAKTESDAIDVYINAGSIYLTRSDYQGALKEANAALAIDEKSGAAQSFRARVGSASADASSIDVGVGPWRRR